ncbi:MAG: Ig-like domain-containing protein [Xanthomonadales bacterium]|nr:Ig-like domain-containing protein [Xanthomonadales bacterium]
MNKRLILILFTLLFTGNALATECCDFQAFNKDGTVVTGVIAPVYDPAVGEYPLPINLAFLGTDDFTLNLPADDPTDFGDPFVALGALDGFSTTEKWIMSFASAPHTLDASTIIPGVTVRMFEVSTVFGTIVAVSGVVRELTPVLEYVAVASGNNVAILPTSPLKEMTTYMVVMTNDIKDTAGNNATPSDRYYSGKTSDPWVDADGHSTYPLLDDATAAALESLRQITQGQENAAASMGVPKEDIILSWTAQTQSITPVLKSLRSIAKPAPTTVGPTGMNTAMVGGAGAADIYAGIITIPYYLGVPSAQNPIAPLTDFWTAAPGAYVAPFDTLGLNPTSTHVTVANPFPVVTSMQTVPLLMTVPNANSGHTKPAAGWPVVIYGHGITRSRADILTMADSAAAAGYAVVAIDLPLHGISPDDPTFGALHISKTPFAGMANERTFDVDYVNNTTGAPGPDGVIDGSGTHIINLSSMLTSRDNFRQGEVDLSVLTVTIPSISYDGDALPDLDGSTIQFVGQSMGSMMGTAFVAIEPMIKNALLSVPMGGIPRALEASPEFGPRIRAGLKAAAGIEPGMSEYEQFFLVFQTVTDSGDPINWSAEAAHYNNILLWEVWGDQVNPNFVETAPLSGTEPMIRAMGLTPYSSTTQNAAGLDLVGRFAPPAEHSTFLSPTVGSADAYFEMQKQMASFIQSKGTAVVVENAATMVPEVSAAGMAVPPVSGLMEGRKSKKAKGGETPRLESFRQATNGLNFFPGKINVSGFEAGARPEPGDGRQLQKPNRVK